MFLSIAQLEAQIAALGGVESLDVLAEAASSAAVIQQRVEAATALVREQAYADSAECVEAALTAISSCLARGDTAAVTRVLRKLHAVLRLRALAENDAVAA